MRELQFHFLGIGKFSITEPPFDEFITFVPGSLKERFDWTRIFHDAHFVYN